jgi:hypothetical protein
LAGLHCRLAGLSEYSNWCCCHTSVACSQPHFSASLAGKKRLAEKKWLPSKAKFSCKIFLDLLFQNNVKNL